MADGDPVATDPVGSLDAVELCLVLRPGVDARALLDRRGRPHDGDAPPIAGAVWAGDPQLRPPAPTGTRWIDLDLPAPAGLPWNLLLVALESVSFGLCRASAALAQVLEERSQPILLLDVGDVAATAIPTVDVADDGLGLIERRVTARDDGLAPGLADLVTAGRFSTAAIVFGRSAGPVATALADALATSPGAPPGSLLDLVVRLEDAAWTSIDGASVLGWTAMPADAPTLIDVSALDRHEPWHVDIGGRRPRFLLSHDPALADVLENTREQWSQVAEPLRLPGGVVVDPAMRALVAEALTDALASGSSPPPDPYGEDPQAFRSWLETPWPPWGPDLGRYWTELWHQRVDLQSTFPQPDGDDRRAFVDWIERGSRVERASGLLRSGAGAARPQWRDDGAEPGGLDLVGYPGSDKSLGDLARRFDRALTDADVPHRLLDHRRSGSPRRASDRDFDTGLRYDTSLVVVNPDQLPGLAAEQPALFAPSRRTIGFWHWDVEYVPDHVRDAARFVDEIWVLTEFTGRSLRAAVDVPVEVLLVPVPEPVESGAARSALGMPDDRFAFLVTFDHLSVTERKNPVGAIEAFCAAFPEPSPTGPVLVVKSANAAHRWAAHERIHVAARGRSDVIIIDRFLDRGDQLAMVARCDCLVSLHRSEGLGLHLMEAMWFAKPTIATRYSGNLAFMDDDNSALVDARLVPVEHGEEYFPAEATWADPDLEQAAGWMRRLAADPDIGARLGSAARRRMEQQEPFEATGQRIAERCGIDRVRSSGTP